MPDLTQQQKDELARWAGGIDMGYGVGPGWIFDGHAFIAYHDWSPATKPEHGDLVLRALVKKGYWPDMDFRRSVVVIDIWNENVEEWMEFVKRPGGSWWPDAVCAAALAVIEQRKEGE